MIPLKEAKRIAQMITNKYASGLRARGFQTLERDELYNQAFVEAIQKDIKAKAYFAADRAVFHLICRKITPSSRHTYGDTDQSSKAYKANRKLSIEPESEQVARTLDIQEALGELGKDEKELILCRVIHEKNLAETAIMMGLSKAKVADKEHFLLLELARRLNSWRNEK
jgi:DNA-directed RNA polymerase specialized sigma24 family protein